MVEPILDQDVEALLTRRRFLPDDGAFIRDYGRQGRLRVTLDDGQVTVQIETRNDVVYAQIVMRTVSAGTLTNVLAAAAGAAAQL